jgi:DNA-directed RNA polymerase specialized sigma24 family protein
MLHLASSITDSFGRASYLEFIRAGVVDMPPLNGAPPSRDLKSVPPGYGKKFGDRVYAVLLSSSRNPDVVEDALSRTLMKMVDGKLHLREGSSLRDAESYVLLAAKNSLKEIWRQKKPEQSFPTSDPENEDDVQINFMDPNSFRHLDKLIPKTELGRLMADLERVNERAPSWLEAKLDGLTGVEIAQEWGVGKSRITNWEHDNVPAIKRVLLRYIQEAA